MYALPSKYSGGPLVVDQVDVSASSLTSMLPKSLIKSQRLVESNCKRRIILYLLCILLDASGIGAYNNGARTVNSGVWDIIYWTLKSDSLRYGKNITDVLGR